MAGLINLVSWKSKASAAGCFPQNHNDHGVQFFYGVPKDGQTLEETEKLILAEIEKIKNGEFEDWILPAVINDFKKRQKEDRENNAKRVEMLRDTFLSSWSGRLLSGPSRTLKGKPRRISSGSPTVSRPKLRRGVPR